jgi:hypothetical protein
MWATIFPKFANVWVCPSCVQVTCGGEGCGSEARAQPATLCPNGEAAAGPAVSRAAATAVSETRRIIEILSSEWMTRPYAP